MECDRNAQSSSLIPLPVTLLPRVCFDHCSQAIVYPFRSKWSLLGTLVLVKAAGRSTAYHRRRFGCENMSKGESFLIIRRSTISHNTFMIVMTERRARETYFCLVVSLTLQCAWTATCECRATRSLQVSSSSFLLAPAHVTLADVWNSGKLRVSEPDGLFRALQI